MISPDLGFLAFGLDLVFFTSNTPKSRISMRSSGSADIIVSEHFGGGSVARADHLERFFLARGLGLVRWERWENFSISRLARREEMAATIAGQGRCPGLDFSAPPAEGWRMVDCRTWTNMVRATAAAPLRALDWPERALR